MNPDRWIERILARHRDWQNGHGDSPHHPSLGVDENVLARALDELADRLAGSHPFFHPRYAGQMIKPPHPVAVLGYLAGMLVNSNNHALDGGPATSRLEVEAVAALAAMLGFGTHLGHLTGGGTVANLEALFVARETHPDRGIAFSTEAHYTHARMCHLLGAPPIPFRWTGTAGWTWTPCDRCSPRERWAPSWLRRHPGPRRRGPGPRHPAAGARTWVPGPRGRRIRGILRTAGPR